MIDGTLIDREQGIFVNDLLYGCVFEMFYTVHLFLALSFDNYKYYIIYVQLFLNNASSPLAKY